jgi:mRNA interferase HigB
MHVIDLKRLRAFWQAHPQAETALKVWYKLVSQSTWSKSQDVKDMFGGNVDFVGDNRAIFDICGNKYRIVVRVAYAPYNRVMIKFVGTHAEYNKLDAEKVM